MERSAARCTRRQVLHGGLALAGFGLLAGCGGLSGPARRIHRIGVLGISTPPASAAALAAGPIGPFLEGLRELGYVDGENLAIEWRWAEGREARLPELAADLVRLPVEVIIIAGSTPAALAAERATSAIPIVFVNLADPVGSGLVESFARPGGNVTGLAGFTPELAGKQVELLKETAPGISRLAVLWHADNPSLQRAYTETQAAAGRLGLQLVPLGVRSADELDAAFEAAGRHRAEALFVIAAAIWFPHRARIAEFAAQHRLPAMAGDRPITEAGGLMTYAVNNADVWRRAAPFVAKILRGANPADLPVELPTKLDFVINVKAAHALGLTIPPSVLQQATEIIQ